MDKRCITSVIRVGRRSHFKLSRVVEAVRVHGVRGEAWRQARDERPGPSPSPLGSSCPLMLSELQG